MKDDTISRKAAIEALGERPMVWVESDYELGARNQYDADVLALETVPSVQPEKHTDKRTETHASDLISRQALCEYALNQKDKNITANDIMRFPPAQPESAKRTAEAAQSVSDSDLISRKAAIDAIRASTSKYTGFMEMEMYTDDDAVEAIEGLPSAQPEPRWVSCSERLPEHGGRYLISVLDGINRRTTVAPYLPRCKAWTMTGRMAYWKVIAWMPLPEPAKEDDNDHT